MTLNIAINGFGRIGRNVLRALYENGKHDIKIVAINDLTDISMTKHLLKYDSVHGRFGGKVGVEGNNLIVNGDKIRITAEKDPADLPWKELGVDMVFECTGLFRSRETAGKHLKAGAKKVIISAPGQDVDRTVVYGVNHKELQASDEIISNASCTTNCLAPMAKVLHEQLGIERGLMTTIHSYTNDQNLLDLAHSDPHRARAAAVSMIPSTTGAAKAVGLVLPEMKGRLDGFAMRVPTPNVSLVDLTFTPGKQKNTEEINSIIRNASESDDLKGVLEYSTDPLVSIDFNHNPASSVFDATQTRVLEDGKLVKVLSWYDNEWGFSNRMLDVAAYFARVS